MSISLTDEQAAIVALNEGCYLVEAPPGAGKTQLLTERVRRLLTDSPAATFRILGLTFTTKAADNLRNRVLEVSPDAAKRVTADTFHGFCLSVLRSHGDRVEFPSSVTIYERAVDRREALARALELEGFPSRPSKELDEILKQISAEKRALRTPNETDDADLAVEYAAYQRVLAESAACDFDDLLVLTWRLFDEFPAVASHYRRLYKFILIDEAQDTSEVQYAILRALCGDEHRSVMLVADKSQGIYGFAGASTEYLDAFVRDFGAKRLSLTHNFRSAKAILEVANALVTHDDRLRKPAVDAVGATGFVGAYVLGTEQEEADFVVRGLKRLVARGLDPRWVVPGEKTSVAPEEIAVLGRSRYCMEALLSRLARETPALPFFFSAGESGLFESRSARLVLDGLRLISNPRDKGTRRALAKAWRVGPDDPLDSIFSKIATEASVAPLAQLLLRIHKASATKPFDINPHMLDAFKLLHDAATAAQTSAALDAEEVTRMLVDAETFKERWAEYRGPLTPQQRSIGGFLGALALSGRSVIRAPGVRVLTIHAAKGLEFRAVFLIGMNERILPDYRSMTPRGIREERRNAYVAVTRCARTLIITRSQTRTTPWGATEAATPSRFLAEMGLTMSPPAADRREES